MNYVTIYAEPINRLRADGFDAHMEHTGGGCMAIEVPLQDGRYVLVTDNEGPLSGDRPSDATRWFVGMYDADGSGGEDLSDPLTLTEVADLLRREVAR